MDLSRWIAIHYDNLHAGKSKWLQLIEKRCTKIRHWHGAMALASDLHHVKSVTVCNWSLFFWWRLVNYLSRAMMHNTVFCFWKYFSISSCYFSSANCWFTIYQIGHNVCYIFKKFSSPHITYLCRNCWVIQLCYLYNMMDWYLQTRRRLVHNMNAMVIYLLKDEA